MDSSTYGFVDTADDLPITRTEIVDEITPRALSHIDV